MIKVLQYKDATTKNGKPYKQLEVECDGEVRKVNMWSNFPNYANITQGSQFEGKMAKEGEYWNLSIEGATSRPGGSQGFKTAQIEKSMEAKAQYIAKAQDHTSNSVKISATMRDAVLLATTEFKNPTVLDNLDESVLKWRKWLWTHWDDPTTEAIYPD